MKRTFSLFIILALFAAFPLQAAKWKAKHVVLIALDGWGAYSLPKANPNDIPNIRSLMDNGCYTLKKRSVLPSSSAINWASMFMGVGTEIHGYTQWGSQTPEIPSRVINEHGICPTIFSELKKQVPNSEVGCLYEWVGIKYLIDTLGLDYHALSPDSEKNPTALCGMAEKYILEKKPTFVAVCFDQLDHTGHTAGYDTPPYYAKLSELDQYVGRIIEATKKAGIWDDTIIMMTSDHGGIHKGHGGKTLEEMEIPFIAAGKGIKKGGEFKESMMQFDTAATIGYVFNLKQPQVWIGRPMKQIFK